MLLLRKFLATVIFLFVVAFFGVIFINLSVIGSKESVKIVSWYLLFVTIAAVLFSLNIKLNFPRWISISTIGLFTAFVCIAFILYNGVLMGEGDLRFYFSRYNAILQSNFQTSENLYSAVFPNTTTYPAILALISKLLGLSSARHFVPIGLNVLAGIIFNIYIYIYIPNKRYAYAAALISSLNPFWIIYTDTVNSELLFGTCILISFVEFARGNRAQTKIRWLHYALSVLFCGVSIVFRPLGIVFLIAVVIYLALDCKKDRLVEYSTVAIAFVLTWCIFGWINNVIVKQITSYDIGSPSFGWNLYVGASESGSWSKKDGDEFSEVFNKANNANDVQSYFSGKAFERYKEFGIIGTLKRVPMKISKAFVSIEYLSKELPESVNRGLYAGLISLYIIPLYSFAALGMVLTLVKNFMKGYFDFNLIIILFFIGVAIAFMFLEVAPRYTVSIHVLMILPAIMLFEKLLYRKIEK